MKITAALLIGGTASVALHWAGLASSGPARPARCRPTSTGCVSGQAGGGSAPVGQLGGVPIGSSGSVSGGGPGQLPTMNGIPCTPQNVGTC
jgi:hypothetical protein